MAKCETITIFCISQLKLELLIFSDSNQALKMYAIGILSKFMNEKDSLTIKEDCIGFLKESFEIGLDSERHRVAFEDLNLYCDTYGIVEEIKNLAGISDKIIDLVVTKGIIPLLGKSLSSPIELYSKEVRNSLLCLYQILLANDGKHKEKVMKEQGILNGMPLTDMYWSNFLIM